MFNFDTCIENETFHKLSPRSPEEAAAGAAAAWGRNKTSADALHLEQLFP